MGCKGTCLKYSLADQSLDEVDHLPPALHLIHLGLALLRQGRLLAWVEERGELVRVTATSQVFGHDGDDDNDKKLTNELSPFWLFWPSQILAARGFPNPN